MLNFMNELTKTIIKSHIIAVLFTLNSKKMNSSQNAVFDNLVNFKQLLPVATRSILCYFC